VNIKSNQIKSFKLAWLGSPGFGLAWAGFGFLVLKPKTKPSGRAWLGLAFAQVFFLPRKLCYKRLKTNTITRLDIT
jgi:hypothetical protein